MDILKTLIFIVIVPIVWILAKQGSKSYFNEKGKNLATKQDIKDITLKVEQVKTDYINQSYAWKKFFDFELENIKNVWNACWELQASARALRPIVDEFIEDEEKLKEKNNERFKNYIEKMNIFINIVIKNQPFIPPEIYTSSLELKKLVIPLFVDFKMSFNPKYEPQWETIHEKNDELDLKINEINEQIRNYIYIKLEPKK